MQFGQLPPWARAYVLLIYALAAGVASHSAALREPLWSGAGDGLWSFAVLTIVAAVAQSFPVSTPGKQAYHVSPPLLIAGVLLLAPTQLTALILIVHVVEWLFLRKRRSWFAQVFNAAAILVSAHCAQALYVSLAPAERGLDLGSLSSVAGALGAAALFWIVNTGLISLAIWISSGLPPRQQRILDGERLVVETVLLAMGVPVACVATSATWAIPFASLPLLLIHRALNVPNLQEHSRRDELTGLPVSADLTELCSRELARAERFGRSVCLVLVDVDRLAAVNASYGREAGDRVIRGAGQALKRTLRAYDVSMRMDGGSFALLLPETSRDGAEAIARRLQHILSEHKYDISSTLDQVAVTVSIGIAIADAGEQSPEHLIAVAQEALRLAKQHGSGGLQTLHAASSAQAAAQPCEPAAVELAASRRASTARAFTANRPNGWGPRPSWRLPEPLPRWAPTLVSLGVALAALLLGFWVLPDVPTLEPITLLVILGLVVLAESRSLELIDRSTFSISTVPLLAAGILLSVPGAVLVAPVCAVVRGIHRSSAWHKVLFNANRYVLGAAGSAAVYRLLAPWIASTDLLPLLVPAAVAGGVFYIVNSVLASLAIAAELRTRPWQVWRENFRWLGPQSFVLGLMALLLAKAFETFGLAGVAAFAMPPLMMRLVAKQYVDRTLSNVRELRSLNERLEHQAFHDPLTGLANRTLFHDRVEHALTRRGPHKLAVLFIDLDHFKIINDSLGHRAGDTLLIGVAERLRECIRPEDTLARMGGDEFTLLVEEVVDAAAVVQLAERIQGQFRDSFIVDGQPVSVDASIGISVVRDSSRTADDVIRDADLAMYRVKDSGRGGYELFDSDQRLAA